MRISQNILSSHVMSESPNPFADISHNASRCSNAAAFNAQLFYSDISTAYSSVTPEIE